MKAISETTPGIPSNGAILRYLIRAVGLPTKAIPGVSDKVLQRLSSVQLNEASAGPLIAQLFDELLQSDAPANRAAQILVSANERYAVGRPFAERWMEDGNGEVVFDRVELANQLARFLVLNGQLRGMLGRRFRGPMARTLWLHCFVVPFLAAKLAELKVIGVDWDAGMPGGRHWYLPREVGSKEDKPVVKGWPCGQVLEWWRDLLGHPLESYAVQLCGDDSDNARRQIQRWQDSQHPPDFSTIVRWTSPRQAWRYDAAFEDLPELPLADRWTRCRDFLAGKNATGDTLEKDIPPFATRKIPFTAFFDGPDPIAAGLPVDELIQRVAHRWRKPTAQEVRLRLFLAAVAQKAMRDWMDTLGFNALVGSQWFEVAYKAMFLALRSGDPAVMEGRVAALKILEERLGDRPAELLILSASFDADMARIAEVMKFQFRHLGPAGP